MTSAVVLDQNMMRRQELRDFILENPSILFVVPDTGLVEMVKSDKWEYTFRRSFACQIEVDSARAVDVATLMPIEFTELLRGAIRGSQDGNNVTMDELRKHMADVRREIGEHDLNAWANRDGLAGRVAEARSRLPQDEIRACRHPGELGRNARREASIAVGNGIFLAHMENLGVPADTQHNLWVTRSMTLRWAYMLAHHTMYWLGVGGLEGMSDRDVLNDVLDQDYVLIGSYFDGVLSRETTVNLAYEDLTTMLKLPNA